MQVLRKPLLVLAIAFLPGLLFAAAVTYGINSIVGKPDTVKKILDGSGIYNSVTTEVLNNSQKSADSLSEVSLENKAVKKAAQSVFGPTVVQDNTEKVIDGTYNWLDGKAPVPDFNINLTSLKSQFADKVGTAATKQAAKLPKCAPGVIPATTDPFKAKCLPIDLTPAQVGSQAENDILQGDGFLADPVLNADSIKNTDSSQSVFADQLKNVPAAYQNLKTAPLVFGLLSILAIIAVVLLSPSPLKGLKRVGLIIFIVGLVLIIFARVFDWGINDKLVPKIAIENNVLQSNVKKLIVDVTNRIDKNYWVFGTIYLVIGAVFYAGSLLAHNSNTATVNSLTSLPKPSRKSKTHSK